MNRILVALGATVAIVVAGFALWPKASTGPGTSATPSASPSAAVAAPSAAAGSLGDPLPTALQARSMGGNNSLVMKYTGSSILLDPSALSVYQSNDNRNAKLTSDAAVVGDELRLRTEASDICRSGDEGRYGWTISPSGRVLTLLPTVDPCVRRADAVAGTWSKTQCREAETNCLGELDAGTQSSQYITPLATRFSAWQPIYGAITYTVPDGWANYADWPGIYGLAPIDAFSVTTAANPIPSARLDVLTQALPSSRDTPCAAKPSATEPADLAALAATPGLAAATPTTTTIDGRDAVWLDLRVAAGSAGRCPDDPVVEYLVAGGEGQAIGENERQRLYLVDVGTDTPLAIQIAADNPADFDALVASATPIVESMHFK